MSKQKGIRTTTPKHVTPIIVKGKEVTDEARFGIRKTNNKQIINK